MGGDAAKPKPKPTQRAKVARRAGETAAAAVATPAATREALFGSVDSSSFEGLGLASSLADHLEGPFTFQQQSLCEYGLGIPS